MVGDGDVGEGEVGDGDVGDGEVGDGEVGEGELGDGEVGDGDVEVTVPVQGVPLSVNDVGVGLLPDQAPLNPKAAVAPVATVALYDTLVTVTWDPDWTEVPFHNWVTVWPPVKVQVSVHPVIGSPRFFTVTAAPNPPGHDEVTE